MLIYFSGTGNTALAATRLARTLGDDQLLPLTPDLLLHPSRTILRPETPADGCPARVIWAFPTHSWGIPPVFVDFLRNVGMSAEMQKARHYMLTTCGDDMAYTDRQWRREMHARGLNHVAAYAVQMPNTYVCMKGFDVDSPEVANAKLAALPAAIEKIVGSIRNGGPDILLRKHFSWIKSAIIYPWFKKHAITAKPFHTTSACISCGRCAAACPLRNITMTSPAATNAASISGDPSDATVSPEKSTPTWGDRCALCLRCYHLCPTHAIAYGTATLHKGQYRAPSGYAPDASQKVKS